MVETFTEGQPAPAATDVSTQTESAPAPTPIPAAPVEDKSKPFENVRAAAQALARRREEKRREAAQAAPPVTESPPQAGEAPQETGPGETQEVDPAVDLSPIEPPRSWKKEYKAAFEALPRNVQEQVAESERHREADFLRRQNEVSERQRAFDTELQQMQAVRQQYEQGLQQTLQMTLSSNEFADIRSMDDVEAMARDDWPRWVRYQTHQQKVSMLQGQLQEVKEANQREYLNNWQSFANEQDQIFSEKYPDAKSLKDAAVNYLKEVGFQHQEIAQSWNTPLWRDHRMQGVILDAVKYRQAKAKADQAKKAPVPTVQKPGVSAPKANPAQAQISELEAKGALSLREAAKLNQLRRMAAKV
jgi:NTP pyrophosphatase (non-canonical NTP hydrolase)